MKKINLCENWQMESSSLAQSLSCHVPCSAVSTLRAHGKMEDPYWRDNEFKVQDVFEGDYTFTKVFVVTEDTLNHRYVDLCCEGLDTIADLELNGNPLGFANNMHRTWRFDCKESLIPGENVLKITFHSPVQYVKDHTAPFGKRFITIRKAACMYGWDWGLDLSDCGIWRDIHLEAYDQGRLSHNVLRQQHSDGTAVLQVTPFAEHAAEGSHIQLTLIAPDGVVLDVKTCASGETVHFTVTDPKLWWPAGYGDQPLYQLDTQLICGEAVCHEKRQFVGLRTIKLDRSEQPDGAKYQFVVNGVSVFFRGENLIIADSILSNTDAAYWEKLIRNCLKSNLNGIRVWGGAYYPPDVFYDLCDRNGILIYQDFMFACSFYYIFDGFLENVRQELEDNLSRIAHHACIGLLCGNNEIDGIYTVGSATEPATAALRILFGAGKDPLPEATQKYLWSNYEPLFLELIPSVCQKLAPDISYVPSSPSLREPGSAVSFFDYLSGGDMHYYLQYDGNAPYQKIREMRSRFMTEIGFQSYPDWKTVCSFTEPEDRLPYTPIMYAHQKCASGNEAIELYMERDYAVPKNFEDYVFLSQVQAGEIMRYTVEHFRRDGAYCRGMILWQLNDCWPVVSWSGIDYYGRWKAMQYYVKRFYAPVLVTAEDTDNAVSLWLSNETPADCSGIFRWQLMHKNGAVLDAGEATAEVIAGESKCCVQLDYRNMITDENRNAVYLHWSFCDGEETQSGTVLFVLAKEFAFEKPRITCQLAQAETGYAIEVTSDRFAKCVGFTTAEGDCIFSDNYFDLLPDQKRIITVETGDCNGITDVQMLERSLKVNTMNDVLLRAKEV